MDEIKGGVSVIVPTHNFGTYIRETLNSILAQTRQPLEVLVIDDGSTDDTADVVGRFDDPRIKYHYQEKAGVSVARNAGLEKARGEYIAFLDADDLWRPGMLEAQVEVLEHNPELIACFTNFVRFDDRTMYVLPDQFTFFPELATVESTPAGVQGARLISGDAFNALIGFGEFPAFPPSLLFRKKMIGGLRFNPALIRCQDADFFLRAIMGGRVAYNLQILAEIRRHESNATKNISLMSVDKLQALLSVRMAATAKIHQRALEDRIDRAQTDAALARIMVGRTWEGLSEYTRSLFGGRPSLRKLRGLIKILYRVSCRMTFGISTIWLLSVQCQAFQQVTNLF